MCVCVPLYQSLAAGALEQFYSVCGVALRTSKRAVWCNRSCVAMVDRASKDRVRVLHYSTIFLSHIPLSTTFSQQFAFSALTVSHSLTIFFFLLFAFFAPLTLLLSPLLSQTVVTVLTLDPSPPLLSSPLVNLITSDSSDQVSPARAPASLSSFPSGSPLSLSRAHMNG